ncbi:MAG: acetylornithine deacetylase [Alphaproteobacteria bacterium]
MPGRSYAPREMIEALIGFDTTSRNSNMELIRFVTKFLDGHGVPYELIPNEDGTKANLFATIGPDVPGGVVLSGHTDVVPVDGQDWHTDPFEVVEKDGRLYGRGTCDMKGFVATALAMVPEFLKRKPERPIHLALSYDEEVGCTGVVPMIGWLAQRANKPRAVIVGEPTSMTVVNANKGIRSFRTTVTGHEVHSSLVDSSVNAVMVAGELIAFLNRLAAEMRGRPDTRGIFDPPHTTISVGRIEGGTAVNITAKECSFIWECRALPEQDDSEVIERFNSHAEELLPGLKARAEAADIATEQLARAPGLKLEEGSPAETLALRLAQQNETRAVAYAAEAGLFQAIDLPTVICGPGDIAQAHQPNEFIELSQIDACQHFLRRLAEEMGEG